MRTRNILVVMLVMALAAITIVSCSNSSKVTNPQPPDNQTGIVNIPNDSLGQRNTPQPMATTINWNSLSALSKRQLILQTGCAENGSKQAPNCKAWAQHIVSAASGGAASLPATCPSASGYYLCPLNHVTQILQNQSASYTYFIPGRVIQMWYGGVNMPHTAFIYASSSSGMSWLDCNFVGGAGNGYVGIHYISWANFYKNVPAYTLYEVF